jgi:hypothetical protein
MSKLFSALVGLSMLGSVGVASAAEPLTDAQLDGVTAGLFISALNVSAFNAALNGQASLGFNNNAQNVNGSNVQQGS